MKDIAIFGAGGFGRELKILIEDINSKVDTYNFIGFFDDGIPKGTLINSYPVLGGVKELNSYSKPLCLAIGLGDPLSKSEIISKIISSNISFPVLIHPSAWIGKDDVRIDKGSIICAGCIITCNIEIKEFVTLNLSCTVGHDTVINDFSSFMPSVNISGEVIINKKVYVGTGAKIINKLEIGEKSIIGAGAVVAKSLPANCTAVGLPAKPIKFH